MDAARLEELLAYCRIDDPSGSDLTLVRLFHDDAVSQLEGAGVPRPEPGTPKDSQYRLLVNRIVLESWESRGTTTEAVLPENQAFRRSLNQLKQQEGIT